MLAGARYINQSTHVIAPSLLGNFDAGHGQIHHVPDFHVFHRGGTNIPTEAKALEVQRDLLDAGLLKEAQITPELPRRLFREDLFNNTNKTSFTHELVTQ
jgi:hypothetical protein